MRVEAIPIKAQNGQKLFDLFIACSSIFLLVMTLLKIQTVIRVPFAVVTCCILPGYSIVRLLRLGRSYLDELLLSFVLSLCCTFILSLLAFTITKAMSDVFLAFSYLPFSLSLLRRYQSEFTTKPDPSFSRRSHTWVMFVVIAFFAFTVLLINPRASFTPTDDILSNWASTQIVVRSPEYYTGVEPLFHLLAGAIYVLGGSNIGIGTLFTSLVSLNVFVFISFYVMAKEYQGKDNLALAPASLLIFTFFSGFGWLYILKENIVNPGNWQSILLGSLDKTYYDVGVGGSSWLYLFARPMSIGFVLVFTLIYLLKRTDLTKGLFTLTYGLLVISLAFVHPPELIIYVLFLAILSIFGPSNFAIRLNESLTAIFLGVASAILIQLSFGFIGLGSGLQFSFYNIVLLGVIIVSKLALHFRKKITIPRVKAIARDFAKVLLYALLLLYFYGLYVWSNVVKDFSVNLVGSWSAYLVPWDFYPSILGVSGILTVTYLIICLKREKSNPDDIFFVTLIVASLILGHVLSFVNTNLFYTAYSERRISLFAIVGASFLAAKGLRKMTHIHVPRRVVAIGICLIVIMGSATTFLTLAFWDNYLTKTMNYVTKEEWAALTYLSSFVKTHPDTIVYAVTDRTMWSLDFASPRLVVQTLSPILWSSQSPIAVLNMLHGVLGTSTTKVIYMDESDFEFLRVNYPGGYVITRALNQLPVLYENPTVKIYNVPNGAPPLSESNAIIVRDSSEKDDPLYGELCDLLSANFYNYTIRNTYELTSTDNHPLIILPRDTSNYWTLLNELHNRNVLVVGSEDIGPIGDSLFEGDTKITISSDDTLLMDTYGANLSKLEVNPLKNDVSFGLSSSKDISELVLADDNQTSFWRSTPYGEPGEGSIGTAELEEGKNYASGINSLKINVGEGDYKYWQFSHTFESIQDWSPFDFLGFWWYGQGDGNTYVVEIISSGGSYWHKFKDSWQGWKYVLIPLKMPSGRFDINGIAVEKDVLQEASWDSVKTINIRLCGDNPNVEGTFYIDKVSLIKRTLSSIQVLVENVQTSKGVNLSFMNTTLPFVSNGSETLNACDISFYGNTGGDLLFGNISIGHVSLDLSPRYASMNITLFLPPSVPLEQILPSISISYALPSISTTRISSEKGAFTTPSLSPTLFSARSGTNVIAFYTSENDSRTPAIASIASDNNVYYLNIIPLLTGLSSDFYAKSETFGRLVDMLEVALTKQLDEDRWGLEEMIVAPILSVDGNVSLTSSFTLINQTGSSPLICTWLSSDVIESKVTSLRLFGSNTLTFNTTKPTRIEGEDFYSSVLLQDQETNVNVSGVCSVYVTFADNRSVCLNNTRFFSIRGNGMLVITRNTHVTVVGRLELTSCRVRGALFSKIGFQDRDVVFDGDICFDVSLADVYKIVENVDYHGAVHVVPPPVLYDEAKDFVDNLLFLFLLVSIFLVTSLLGIAKHEKD